MNRVSKRKPTQRRVKKVGTLTIDGPRRTIYFSDLSTRMRNKRRKMRQAEAEARARANPPPLPPPPPIMRKIKLKPKATNLNIVPRNVQPVAPSVAVVKKLSVKKSKPRKKYVIKM